MYLKIDSNITVDLPEHLDIDERKELCNDIIEQYRDYLTYRLPTTANDKSGENVQKRLSVLASYLYKCVKDTRSDNVLTEYKERRDRIKEVKFSTVGDTCVY